MKYALLALLALLLGGSLPKPKSTVALHRTATQLWVVLNFTASGNITYLVDSAGVNVTGGPYIGHGPGVGALPAMARKDSFAFALAAPGVLMSGWAGVKACNTAGCSLMSFNPWTYTVPAAPPGAKMDSLRVYPANATVIGGQALHLCAFGFFADGSVRRDSIPATGRSFGGMLSTAKHTAYCDSIGRARWPLRFAATTRPTHLGG